MDTRDISHRFAFHPAEGHDVAAELHAHTRQLLHSVAQEFNNILPEGREKALVVTHLEEAMMWANAAIARNHDKLPHHNLQPLTVTPDTAGERLLGGSVVQPGAGIANDPTARKE